MNCRKMRRNLEGHMAKKATKAKATKKPASKYIRKPTKAGEKKAA